MDSILPTSFSASIGGYLGGTYELRLEDDEIIYEAFGHRNEPDHEERFSPSLEDWRKFVDELVRIGVHKWSRSYDDPDVMDGTSWQLSITAEDLEIDSMGSNEYPKGFRKMLAAVRELIGGRNFS